MDEMQNRLVREKEERQKLLNMMEKARQAEAEDQPKPPKSKKAKTCIRPGNRGRALSPSKAIPETGWRLSILDCPHAENRMAMRENKTTNWMTGLDCGSRRLRIHGDRDFLDNLG